METTWSHPPGSTDRVSLVIQIRIFGSDVSGRVYCEEAQTLEVSRKGALILTNRNLTPQEELLIRVKCTAAESPAQIIGQVRKQPGGFVYGVKLLDLDINLWRVTFAPSSESKRAGADMLLECSKCLLREVIYLEEFETEVYHANRYIFHSCRRCRESTIWNETAHERTERVQESFLLRPAPPPEPDTEPRNRNDRRHNRIGCKLLACIRFKQHYEDEVLEINDVSRGGACFTTRKYLAPGTKIEIAVPYSPGMANIFVPAEIVRLKAIPDKSLYECGAAYTTPLVPANQVSQPITVDSLNRTGSKTRATELPRQCYESGLLAWGLR